MPQARTTFIAVLHVGYMLLPLFALLSVASAQTCIQPPAGLVSWWPGDGNAQDITGPNDGTLQGGTTFVPGMVRQAFSFDGVDDYVSIPDGPTLDITDAITISVWIKPNVSSYDEWTSMIQKGDGVYGINFFGNSFNFEPLINGNYLEVRSGIEPVAGNWYHVAATYDGSVATIYINGDLQNSVTASGQIDTNDFPLFFGENSQTRGRYFNGSIDEVQIFNRALTTEEIQAIFNAGSAGMCKEGAGGVGGTVTGLQPALIVCENLTTEQVVVIWEQAPSWNCETAGLEVTPDDIIRITLVGGAQ